MNPSISLTKESQPQSLPNLRTWVLGIPVDVLRIEALMQRVAAMVEEGGAHLICYLNADCANRAVSDRAYRAILQQADLVYADGMSIVWASRLTEQHLPERMTMADGMLALCQMAVERGLRLFFFGGRPGVAAEAARKLAERFPGLHIVGTREGFMEPEQESAVIDQINAARPDILLVGLGAPRQEKWLWRNQDGLQAPVRWGVGALFEYYAGTMPRAPRWLRERGFEWLYRLRVEPARLWRRYLLGNFVFIFRVLRLLVVDALLVTLAWLGAYGLRATLDPVLGVEINPVHAYLMMVPLLVGCWLTACVALGLYKRAPKPLLRDELVQVAQASCLGWSLAIAAGFILRELSLGRSVVLLAGPLLFLLLVVSRCFNRFIERSMHAALRRTLVVGTDDFAKRATHDLETQPTGYDILGFVQDSPKAPPPPGMFSILGGLDELGELVKSNQVDEVVVASRQISLFEAMNLLELLEGLPVALQIASPELANLQSRLPLGRLAGVPAMRLPRPERGRGYAAVKRAIDVLIAGSALALAAPAGMLIALIVRLETPGPAFFIQERVGEKGRPFSMFKFRTMVVSADPYNIAPNDIHDPRVTRFGRFLRRWSLDELPQLWNVLCADMSLIGPRPEMPFLVAQYEAWQRQRLSVKPGLTCLWQVLGRKELPLHTNLEYDLYYVRHRSLRLDLAILFRTVPAVFSRRGAF